MSILQRLGDAWRAASQRIDRAEARRLLEQVCACSHADLIAHPEREMNPMQVERFEALVARREAGEPLAYLLGSAWFAGLEFAVTPDVLIPRPDTEVLVDLACARAQEMREPRIVDLGTGSGIIPIVLAKRCPHARITAVDFSPAALAVAQANAERHGAVVRFLEGDWFAPLIGERFDLIVSNPPYVAAEDAHLLRDGLPFEPRCALTDGVEGGDGTACLQAIIGGAAEVLSPGGWLLLEPGLNQGPAVRTLLRDAGFYGVKTVRDLESRDRVTLGQRT